MGIGSGLLTWLSSHWHPWPMQIVALSYRSPNLDHLPTELILMIAGYLTICDRACLTLCSHRLFSVLGNDAQYTSKKQFRFAFLRRLTRDRANHIQCHVCRCSHRRGYIQPQGPGLWPRRCQVKHTGLSHLWWYPFSVEWSSLHRFQHIHLQLDMGGHHCSPATGVSTDSLAYLEIRPLQKSLVTLVSVDTQIVPALRYCLRIQVWILAAEFPCTAMKHTRICAHIWLQDHYILEVVRALWGANSDTKFRRRAGLDTYRCEACGLDYQIDVISLGTEGVALVISKWLDLGPGLDPTDIQWTRHLPGTRYLRKYEFAMSDTYVRSQFEQDTMLLLHRLIHRNGSLLRDTEYMKRRDWSYSGRWILQAQPPGFYCQPEKARCHMCEW